MPSSTFCSSSTNRTRSLVGLTALMAFASKVPDPSARPAHYLLPLTTAADDRLGQETPAAPVQFQSLEPPRFRLPREPSDPRHAPWRSSRNQHHPVDSADDAARQLHQCCISKPERH